ncbi:MAG TPA: HEAT repeat domain-containing protein [Ktedonobacterales bacterium]
MTPDIKQPIAEYESTTDHWVRWRVLDVLFHLQDRQVVPDLIAALATPTDQTRVLVIVALDQLGDERAVGPLIGILERKEYGSARANVGGAAVAALGRLGEARALDVLVAALDHSLTHYQAVEALGKLADVRVVPALIAAMHAFKLPSAATVLGNFGDARAVEPLITELRAVQQPRPPEHLDKSKRWDGIYFYYIIRALGKLGDPRALPILEWVREHQTEPVLKGKSLSDLATRAIQRIRERMGSEMPGTNEDHPRP